MFRSKRILLVSIISVIFVLSSSFLPKPGEEEEPTLMAPASGKIGWVIAVSAINLNPNSPCTFRYRYVDKSYGCPGKGGKRLYTDSNGSVTGEIELPQVSYEHQGLGTLIVSAGPKTAVQEFTIVKTDLTWQGKPIIGHDIQILAHNLPPNLPCGFLWRWKEGASRSNSKLTTDQGGNLKGTIKLPIVPEVDQDKEGTLYIESLYKYQGARIAAISMTFEKAVLEAPAKVKIGHNVDIKARNLPPNAPCRFLWRWGGKRPGHRSSTILTTDNLGDLQGTIKFPIVQESDQGEGILYLESDGRLASTGVTIEKAILKAPITAITGHEIHITAEKLPPDLTCRFLWRRVKSHTINTTLTTDKNGNLEGHIKLPDIPESLYGRGSLHVDSNFGKLASQRLIIEGKQEAFVRNLSDYIVKLGTDMTFIQPNWGQEDNSGLGSLLEGGMAAGGSIYELEKNRVRAYVNATSNSPVGVGTGSTKTEIGVMFLLEGVDGAKNCESKTAYVIFEGRYKGTAGAVEAGQAGVKMIGGLYRWIKDPKGKEYKEFPEVGSPVMIFSPTTYTAIKPKNDIEGTFQGQTHNVELYEYCNDGINDSEGIYIFYVRLECEATMLGPGGAFCKFCLKWPAPPADEDTYGLYLDKIRIVFVK